MKFLIVIISIFLFVIAGCSNSNNEHAVPKDWVEYKVPNVFSIKHPNGWDVKFNKNIGRIKLTGKRNEDVYIWPVYSPGELDEYTSSKLLKRIAAKLEPELYWDEPVQIGQNYIRLVSSNKHEISVAGLTWVSDKNSSAALCYIITSPRNYFNKNKDTLIDILGSFHPVIKRSKELSRPKIPKLQFYRWEDPNEHAFSVEVPKGWIIQGGLKRYSPTDYRPGVNLLSPDKEINVFYKDPGIPIFALPNPTLSMSGIYEGSYYRLQDGTMTFVRRYVTGSNFAYEYAGKRFSKELANFYITEKRNRPDIAYVDGREYAALNASGMGMIHSSVTAGDVNFTGRMNSRLYSGYVEAATHLIQTAYGGTGDWTVQQLYGFCAPKLSVREAAMVMDKLVSGFMWNPRWYMMQNKITANVSRIVSRANEQISNIINSSFEIGQKNTDDALRKFDDYIRGTITLHDKNGKIFNVWNTSNYYWADKFDDVGGTKLFINPDISQFRKLFEVK